jgi:protocatechuate 3,4-dioxygenase beta subunit
LRSLAILAAVMLIASPPVLSDCRCTKALPEETTRHGGNVQVVLVDDKPYGSLQGVIEYQVGGRVDGALVELFDHGEYLTQETADERKSPPKQTRIAACKTGPDGKFCFRNVLPGRYEIRSSVGSGINVSSMSVIVDPQKGHRKLITIRMTVGT